MKEDVSFFLNSWLRSSMSFSLSLRNISTIVSFAEVRNADAVFEIFGNNEYTLATFMTDDDARWWKI